MSRIGKKPIAIPAGVEVKIEGQKVIVKGPKGELIKEIRPEIGVEVKDSQIQVNPKKERIEGKVSPREMKQIMALWGLTRALLANDVLGVVDGFEKKLEIHGIGFKAAIEGEEIVLNVGFSNPVRIKIPKEVKVSVEKNIINVSGISKELVGQMAAVIRKAKPPEPYKGKGIRYLNEVVRRKVGKKAATTAS